MIVNEIHLAELLSPVQTIRARVELYDGSTLARICNCGDILSDFTIERTGEGKFFGFGVCQGIKVNLIESGEPIDITTINGLEASFGVNGNFVYPFPKFAIQECARDEVERIISLTAYDALYRAAEITLAEVSMPSGYTLKTFVEVCGAALGLPVVIDEAAADSFNLAFENGGNFDGSESLRTALDAAAEITQTIYYIDGNWNLYFKRLNKDAAAAVTISRNEYFDLTDEGTLILANVAHATELGDNLEPVAAIAGETQYIRENPFYLSKSDDVISELLEAARDTVSGLNITQFECEWMGNYLIEIGDKIEAIKHDNNILTAYLLSDVITYDGALMQSNSWTYGGNDGDTISNPTNISEVIKKTSARVDKVNQRIELLAQDTEANFAAFDVTTKDINAKVGNLEGDLTSFKLTSSNALIEFENNLEENGVSKLKTKTGFTFDENGLTIEKSGSEMSTLITEDGMRVYKDDSEMLTANNSGVNAVNLRATTFLIIGEASQFETTPEGRTGCFWIGKQGGI